MCPSPEDVDSIVCLGSCRNWTINNTLRLMGSWVAAHGLEAELTGPIITTGANLNLKP